MGLRSLKPTPSMICREHLKNRKWARASIWKWGQRKGASAQCPGVAFLCQQPWLQIWASCATSRVHGYTTPCEQLDYPPVLRHGSFARPGSSVYWTPPSAPRGTWLHDLCNWGCVPAWEKAEMFLMAAWKSHSACTRTRVQYQHPVPIYLFSRMRCRWRAVSAFRSTHSVAFSQARP